MRTSFLHIPVSSSLTSTKGTNLLKFKELSKEEFVDPYDVFVQKTRSEEETRSDFMVRMNVNANQDVEAVAAQISITNVMKFVTTSEGTMKMSRKVSSSRERLFDSIADCCFCADEANRNFFDEED